MMTAISGPPGKGKTLFMTYIGLKDYLRGRNIFSNYDLNFPKNQLDNRVMKVQPEQLFDVANKVLVNATILLDEMWVFLDSRRSTRNSNIVLSQLLLQSRKRTVSILGTAQSFRQFDVRFRDNIDYYVEPEMRKDILIIKLFNTHTGLSKRYSINASYLYDLYDTNQIIDPRDYIGAMENAGKNGGNGNGKTRNSKQQSKRQEESLVVSQEPPKL